MNAEGAVCEFCGRPVLSPGGYCHIHEKAFHEVRKGFELWQKAFAYMSWERYLESISGLKETGEASKELAKHLLKQIN